MQQISDSGGALVALAAVALLLVLAGGGAFVWMRQQALVQAQMARVEMARLAAEQAQNVALKQEQAVREARAQKLATENGDDAADSRAPESAIREVLRRQQDAWNRGDLEAFMEYYWSHDAMTFVSDGQVHRGRQAALESYRERFPSPDDMGELSLGELEVDMIDKRAALVLGNWRVRQGSQDKQGVFTLLLRQIDGTWKIVHDHASSNLLTPESPP